MRANNQISSSLSSTQTSESLRVKQPKGRGVSHRCQFSPLTWLTGKKGQFSDFSDGSAEGRRYSTDSDSKSGTQRVCVCVRQRKPNLQSHRREEGCFSIYWTKTHTHFLAVYVCVLVRQDISDISSVDFREFTSKTLETKTEEHSCTAAPLLSGQVWRANGYSLHHCRGYS